jgi:hypothetical protein
LLEMIVNSDMSAKVLVCAPSNAAVDEIISRLSPLMPEGVLLRVGAIDYEPSPEVLKHTLEDRVR